MLYFRQILIMLVSLYTVRVVLETLGAEDYGIYNVVAGVVTMFGFLSGSMALASQRYFAFEIGRGNFEQLRRVFSLSLVIYVLIGILVLVLAETAGLWFVINKLVIPTDRKSAALWVYQFSIISFLFTIMVTPYMAAIIAHEDMNIYAYVSIAEAVLKLGILFLLRFILIDKLSLYGILLCVVNAINTMIYRTICSIKYKECKYKLYWDKGLFEEIASFTGWNLFGNIAWICKNQIINILLNQFFNPIVIAARGIASSVNSAVTSFSNNFSAAMRPQIIKIYAVNKRSEALFLVFRGSKGTYFLMYIFILPLILEMPMVLSLWIKNVPEYTVLFTRLVLIDTLIDSISYPTASLIQATGKIKLYQGLVGSVILLNLPVSWILLMFDFPSYSVMIVSICITFIAFVMRLFIVRLLVNYSITQFFHKVIVPISIVSILSMILPVAICNILDRNFLRLCIVTSSSVISISGLMYFIGLNKAERKMTRDIIKNRFLKFRRSANF
jgi:O-antigen/teichoic acid export membrane protein